VSGVIGSASLLSASQTPALSSSPMFPEIRPVWPSIVGPIFWVLAMIFSTIALLTRTKARHGALLPTIPNLSTRNSCGRLSSRHDRREITKAPVERRTMDHTSDHSGGWRFQIMMVR